jgi:hypothetical protein
MSKAWYPAIGANSSERDILPARSTAGPWDQKASPGLTGQFRVHC